MLGFEHWSRNSQVRFLVWQWTLCSQLWDYPLYAIYDVAIYKKRKENIKYLEIRRLLNTEVYNHIPLCYNVITIKNFNNTTYSMGIPKTKHTFWVGVSRALKIQKCMKRMDILVAITDLVISDVNCEVKSSEHLLWHMSIWLVYTSTTYSCTSKDTHNYYRLVTMINKLVWIK